MIDSQTYARLQDVIRRTGRSLLQYAVESYPWTPENGQDTLARVQQMAGDERDADAALAQLLVRHHLSPPWLGPYPTEFTSYNYITLDRLLPLLVEYQRKEIAALEQALTEIRDEEVRHRLQHLLDTQRHNLKQLEALASPAKQPVGD